jgi:alkylation response protein AidB-like acyl-CoA dehydrogenase
MTDTSRLVEDAAHRLFTQHVTVELLVRAEKGEWPSGLWDAIDAAGLLDTLADRDSTPAERAANAATLLRAAARHLVPLPLGETLYVRACLAARKIRAPKGPLTFQILDGRTHTHGDHAHLEGVAQRVPYASAAAHVLLATPQGREAVLIPLRRARLEEGRNMAAEPRHTAHFADTAGTTVEGISGEDLRLAGAALRSMSMVGALERLLLQTVEYARTRVQFGKPIAGFQAIQQQLAVLAGHVAAAGIAAEAAVCDIESFDRLQLSAPVAKIRCGEAAGAAASIAHQVHGAIGITKEHSLHFATRRLWSWRAEFGSESFWAERLGRDAAAKGAENYWPSITAV